MRRKLNCFVFLLLPALAFAQRSPERSLTDRATQLNTDQQIALYQKQTTTHPSNPHLQNLLASAYIQKVRESTDFTYLDRASKIVDSVLSADAGGSTPAPDSAVQMTVLDSAGNV